MDVETAEEDASNWKEGIVMVKVMLGVDGRTFAGMFRKRGRGGRERERERA
jgi:hypothetical protein